MTIWTPAFERNIWLGRAVTNLRPLFNHAGLLLPKRVLVRSGRTEVFAVGRPALGQCSPSTARAEHLPLITINEEITPRSTVLATLVHELIHAADDCRSMHGTWFAAWARALDLAGLPSTSAGPALVVRLEAIGRLLGPYPAVSTGYNLTSNGTVAA